MVTHSSITAWRILWTEEPGRLQFMGSQRAGHYKLVGSNSSRGSNNLTKSLSIHNMNKTCWDLVFQFYWHSWHKIMRHWKCTSWWFNVHRHCERITPILLINTFITWCIYPWGRWAVRTFKFYSFSKFRYTAQSQGRGAWWAAIYGVAQSRTRLKRLSSRSSSSSYTVQCYHHNHRVFIRSSDPFDFITETLYPITNISYFPYPQPWQPLFSSVSILWCFFRFHIYVILCSICISLSGLF